MDEGLRVGFGPSGLDSEFGCVGWGGMGASLRIRIGLVMSEVYVYNFSLPQVITAILKCSLAVNLSESDQIVLLHYVEQNLTSAGRQTTAFILLKVKLKFY